MNQLIPVKLTWNNINVIDLAAKGSKWTNAHFRPNMSYLSYYKYVD